VKRDMFGVLQADEVAMGLTESLAMTPAASVSGFYLSHPESAYFNVGKVGDDQIASWAERARVDADEAKRALASLL
jgi:5-methyltetrahydrofolate--homocysteine methyltransferase